jgi:hypothetical protein
MPWPKSDEFGIDWLTNLTFFCIVNPRQNVNNDLSNSNPDDKFGVGLQLNLGWDGLMNKNKPLLKTRAQMHMFSMYFENVHRKYYCRHATNFFTNYVYYWNI